MMYELILDVLLLYLTMDNGLLFFVLLDIYWCGHIMWVCYLQLLLFQFSFVTLFVLCVFVTCLHRCYLHPYLNNDQFHIQPVYGGRWI
jgi:hypothetical protein